MVERSVLARQLLRRKPVAHDERTVLDRTLGIVSLTNIGIGATIGTGIFFVMSSAVPQAGPAVLISFIIAGVATGLAMVCYAELASAVPVSGSTYAYAYAAFGEIVAMGVAAALVLQYGIAGASVAVGWSGYLNELLDNVFGVQIPQAISAAPFDDDPGWVNLPAMLLVVMCATLLIRGARESAGMNTVMVVVKILVLGFFIVIAFTAFDSANFTDFAPFGVSGVAAASSTIFFSYVGLDTVSTAGEEVKDPQRAMPRALIGALVIVGAVYLLVAISALGTQPWQDFEGQADAGLAVILENVVGAQWPGTVLAAGAVVSIFSVTLMTMYGQTRIFMNMAQDGMLPARFGVVHPHTRTPVFNTVVVAVFIALIAGVIPLDNLINVVSMGTLACYIVVSVGVIVLRRSRPDLPRAFKVPGYPITPILAIAACVWVASGLPWSTVVWFAIWVAATLVFYLCWGRRHSRLNDHL